MTALAGVGGGNFASSMVNINNFYPHRLKGRALGLNAGGGNLGVAVVQIVGAMVLVFGGAGTDPRVMLYLYVPLVLVVTALAWTQMDNLTEATNDKGAMREVARHRHTAIVSFLYIGTFGSFIGFGFAFGQVLAAAGAERPIYFVWLGAFVGSIIRPVGGMLADRFKGSTVTLWNFVAMVAASVLVLLAARADSIPVFIAVFTVLFALTGIGNGYKMIPAIFHAESATRRGAGADVATETFQARRLASALVGVAGAVGAFGGVLVRLHDPEAERVHRTVLGAEPDAAYNRVLLSSVLAGTTSETALALAGGEEVPGLELRLGTAAVHVARTAQVLLDATDTKHP